MYGLLLLFYAISGIIIADAVISMCLFRFLVIYVVKVRWICYNRFINLALCFVNAYLV